MRSQFRTGSQIVVAVILFWMVIPVGSAQTPLPDMKRANDFYQARDFVNSAAAYGDIVKAQPDNGLAWLRYAASLGQLSRYDEAFAAYEKAITFKAPQMSVDWNEGRTYARMGQKDKAFEYLQSALNAGFSQSNLLKSETDLDSLRGDPRFARLVELADRNARPCDFDPHYREFDFWVGEWDVRPANTASLAGTSVIEKILGSCVILENWTGSAGGSGKSFNVYDSTTQKWEQIWVDASGTLTKYAGGIKDGAMDYFADAIGPQGKPVKLHLQFFKLGPDQVRQFSQFSTDGGANWATGYDFIYTRKKSTP